MGDSVLKQAPFIHRWWVRLTLLALVLVSVVQCGGAFGASAKVNLQLLPNLPIVSLATLNVTYTDPTTGFPITATITAPWYELTMSIANNSTEYLTLAGFQYQASYMNGSNLTTQSGLSLTTTNLGPQDMCEATTGVMRSMIVEGLAPGQTYTGTTGDHCNDWQQSPTEGITSTTSDIYYVSSLPTANSSSSGSTTGTGTNSNPDLIPTTYFLIFYAQGWFEANARTSTDAPQGPPIERFVWEGFMTTQ